MKSFPKLTLSLLLAVCLSFSLSAQSESDLQELYKGVLEQVGIEGRVDGDGDVQFEYEEKTYFLEVNESDTEFYRLVMPNIWPIESELERIKVLKAVNEVNLTKKVAKAYAVNDNVWIAVEMFLPKTDNFIDSFERQIKVIQQSVDLFVENMDYANYCSGSAHRCLEKSKAISTVLCTDGLCFLCSKCKH